MRVCCGQCGGPLYRSACYGRCLTPVVKRQFSKATKVQDADVDTFLRWSQEFQSGKGAVLNVAVWRAYRVSSGHPVLVWPKAA